MNRIKTMLRELYKFKDVNKKKDEKEQTAIFEVQENIILHTVYIQI